MEAFAGSPLGKIGSRFMRIRLENATPFSNLKANGLVRKVDCGITIRAGNHEVVTRDIPRKRHAAKKDRLRFGVRLWQRSPEPMPSGNNPERASGQFPN